MAPVSQRKLDFSRPFAEVHGLPGAVYEQDGIKFMSDGAEALAPSPIVEEPAPYKGPEINPPEVSCIEASSMPPDDKTGLTLQDMHWKKLKVMVESYGGVWTNREDAIHFMKKGK